MSQGHLINDYSVNLMLFYDILIRLAVEKVAFLADAQSISKRQKQKEPICLPY